MEGLRGVQGGLQKRIHSYIVAVRDQRGQLFSLQLMPSYSFVLFCFVNVLVAVGYRVICMDCEAILLCIF